MKILKFCCKAFSIGAAAAILAAWGGNQTAARQLPATSVQPLHALRPSSRLRYRLVILRTFGGPQSFFSGNINDDGAAAGVADTGTADPFYPNANPFINYWGADKYIYHAFIWRNGQKIDLGALPGANSSFASWINENGIVSGQSINGMIDPLTGYPEENAVIFMQGHVINLGTLGGYESGAGVVNDRGHTAGFSSNSISDPNSMFGFGTQTRAFIYRNGRMRDLGTLGGTDAFAAILNGRDQVIGFSYPNSSPGACLPFVVDGFVWQNGKMTDLGSFGGTCTFPNAINERGQIVGSSNLPGDTASHAFIWYPRGGRLRDLGTLGGSSSGANGINEDGDVVGDALIASDVAVHGFFWSGHGPLVDMGTVSGLDCSFAVEINNKGQATGNVYRCAGGEPHTFLWQKGRMIDLNVFVPPSVHATLVEAAHINDRGEIFGNATLANGHSRAFVLEPCDDNSRDDGCIEAVGSHGLTGAHAPALNRPMTLAEMRKPLLHRLPFSIVDRARLRFLNHHLRQVEQ